MIEKDIKSPVDSLFIRTIHKKDANRTPVWLMRQAGRYLPEYRRVRAQAGDFLTLCKTPTLACEVTLQPLARFDLDAAILFSDILTIPDAMGLGLHFVEGEGPCFERPLRTFAEIQQLSTRPLLEKLQYVMDAARLIRASMPAHLPLIGFSGSPWTLACYMIEGRSSRTFSQAIQWMYTAPEQMHVLLSTLTTAVTDYLLAQVAAGADVLMLFDTWGGLLSSGCYFDFSLHYMRKIVHILKEKLPHIPVILFTKGGGSWLTKMADTGCDVVGLDWSVDLSIARQLVGGRVALQGNLDPAVLLTNPECIVREVRRVLAAYGQGSGHVFNLGHGITPDVPPEHVQVMVEAVHQGLDF
jgi:uroporphyrinogen decarboxylase